MQKMQFPTSRYRVQRENGRSVTTKRKRDRKGGKESGEDRRKCMCVHVCVCVCMCVCVQLCKGEEKEIGERKRGESREGSRKEREEGRKEKTK